MGTDLKTLLILVRVDQGEVSAHACDMATWRNGHVKRMVPLLSKADLILTGFETPVGEFEVQSERGRGMVDLCELYPSIYRLEGSRTLYRFGRESELVFFRMQWDWL
jgi:hypothetical protein